MRLAVVLLATAIGCTSRAIPEGASVVVVGPPDLSVVEQADLGSPPPSDLAASLPASCGVATQGSVGVPTPPFDQTTVEAGAYVASFGLGDLDGDGFVDLVTANRNDFVGDAETISVILSSAAGSFRPQTKYAAPLYPQSVALGDFNRDGRLDVVADTGTMLDVRLNLGAGVLGAARQYADNTRGAPALAVVDVDGDGKLDLVTESSPPIGAPDAHAIDVRLGRGDGTFADPWTLQGAGGELLAGADFDEDGLADVVFVSQESRTFGIALGQPDGTLSTRGRWALSAYPQGLAVGDIDADGHVDIVVGTYNPSAIVVVRGDGRGGFDCMTSYPAGSSEQAIAIADFNRDGRPDLIVTNYWNNELQLFAGVGGGALAGPVTLPNAIDYPEAIAVGDFDRDGNPDVAVGSSSNNLVTLLFNRMR